MYRPKLAFLALLGLYFGISIASAEPGFEPALSANAPAAVKTAAIRVLRIWTPQTVASLAQNSYASLLQEREGAAPADLRTAMRFQMNRAELARCQTRGMSYCEITTRVAVGSAFVLEDGTLIAARHDFSEGALGLNAKFARLAADWKTRQSDIGQKYFVQKEIAAFKQNPLKDTLFVLTDASGAVVFNSAAQDFRFLRYGDLSQFRGSVDLHNEKAGLEGENLALETSSFNGAEWVMRDSVRIQLSVRLPGLASAHGGCGPGASIFIVGFSGRGTTTRAALGARDAWRDELSLSQGVVLRPDQVLERAGEWDQAQSYLKEVAGRPPLMTDADGTTGMSGGPMLNDQGQVCGMFKMLFPGDEKPDYLAGSRILQLFSFGVPSEYLTGI